jgi:hypothetical protein
MCGSATGLFPPDAVVDVFIGDEEDGAVATGAGFVGDVDADVLAGGRDGASGGDVDVARRELEAERAGAGGGVGGGLKLSFGETHATDVDGERNEADEQHQDEDDHDDREPAARTPMCARSEMDDAAMH